MADDLVERVAAVICIQCSSQQMARAAIAIALEEAAKVADDFESDADPDAGRVIAAAIRAMIKEKSDG